MGMLGTSMRAMDTAERERLLRHAQLRWQQSLTDWQKVQLGARLLATHVPPGKALAVLAPALAVLDDEHRWPEIHHPDGHGVFSQVRHATLEAHERGQVETEVTLLCLENLLKTAYNLAWRPGMFPPFDADARDWIFVCMRQLDDHFGGTLTEDLWRMEPVADAG